MGAHAGGGGGGSQAVGCLLARDAAFGIRQDAESTAVLWDALYDNFWDLDPLAAIPDGLGLTFAFDGSSSLVVPTEPGIWSLSYFATRATDASWAGNFAIGIGVTLPWIQQRLSVSPSGTPYMAGTVTAPLPAGTQITHNVGVEVEAAASPYTCTQVYLSIVRHA